MCDTFWNDGWVPGETENRQRVRGCRSRNPGANLANTAEVENRSWGWGLGVEVVRAHQLTAQDGEGAIWRLSSFIPLTYSEKSWGVFDPSWQQSVSLSHTTDKRKPGASRMGYELWWVGGCSEW